LRGTDSVLNGQESKLWAHSAAVPDCACAAAADVRPIAAAGGGAACVAAATGAATDAAAGCGAASQDVYTRPADLRHEVQVCTVYARHPATHHLASFCGSYSSAAPACRPGLSERVLKHSTYPFPPTQTTCRIMTQRKYFMKYCLHFTLIDVGCCCMWS
jgi:hypothetical protein